MGLEPTTTATSEVIARSGEPAPGAGRPWSTAVDLWIRNSLGGAKPDESIWLARLRGLALAGAALTLAMSAWKAIGPVTTADLFLFASVVLLLPRFNLATARKMWLPGLAVALIAVGGLIGTVAGSDASGSLDVLSRFVAASVGALLLIVCWRPGLEQIKSFGWLWIAGGVASAIVALLIPHLHDFIRPSGLTPQSNHLAMISLILLGVTLGLIASDPRRKNVLVGLTAAGLLLAAVVASGSRAGLVAALIVVLLALIATRNRITVAVTAGVVVVGLALVLAGAAGDDNALSRLSSGDASSDAEREAFNEAAWERFKDKPITGDGFADSRRAHNLFLQVGSSAGVLGILGAVLLIVLALRSYVIAVWKRMAENPRYWAVVAGLTCGVIGYLAQSMFQNVLWDRNVWIAIALMTWGVAAQVGGSAGSRGDPAAS